MAFARRRLDCATMTCGPCINKSAAREGASTRSPERRALRLCLTIAQNDAFFGET